MNTWLTDALATQPNETSHSAVRERIDDSVRPPGSFDRLDDLVVGPAGWQHKQRPRINHPAVIVFTGDHGVVEEQVSRHPPKVSAIALSGRK